MKKGFKLLLCLVVIFGLTMIISNGSNAEDASLRFSNNALLSLSNIEKGPVYLPFDDFSGSTWVYDITVNNDEDPESLSVEWISGTQALKDLYYTQQRPNGRWMLKYNSEYGGTGTAKFRLTAGLNGETVKRDFTVNVTEAPIQSRPTLRKESVNVTVGKSVALKDLNLLDSIEGCDVLFMGVLSSGGTSTVHHYEDKDGFRYELADDSTFTANEAGNYTISIMVKPSYNLSKNFRITVVATESSASEDQPSEDQPSEDQTPETVSLDQSGTVTLKVGKKLTLNATVTPADADTKLTWKSSKKDVAKVSKKGVVTALKAGTTTITVSTDNGKTAKVKIKVTEKSVSLKKVTLKEGKKLTLKVGEKRTLTPKLTPSSATAKLTWSSSNEKIVKVSKKGVIKALKKGKATITVTADNGKKAEIKITVKKAK